MKSFYGALNNEEAAEISKTSIAKKPIKMHLVDSQKRQRVMKAML
jgi:hypothetical protein